MESIFYAALALHIAGKPVSKENIRAVCKAAGTPAEEPALEAIAAFVEALETGQRSQRSFDPRIIKLLTSELARRRVHTEQVETLLAELNSFASPMAEVDGAVPAVFDKALGLKELIGEGKKSAVDTLPPAGVIPGGEGRYIYGIAAVCREVALGQIGIEDNQVYTIPYRDICAIVHDCPLKPYESDDSEMVKTWVGAHQRVLDEAKKRFGTIIPLGFDTIIRPRNGAVSPDQVVKDWLREDHDWLITIMQKIEGKDEYGVQVFDDLDVIYRQISAQSDEVRQIKKEMVARSPGMAYMYRQKLEKVIRSEMEKLAGERFSDFYGRIKIHSDDIVVEKTKKADRERVMLLNLSCLVAREKVESLGEELEKISNTEGFSVRFSGPWPPYSFVAKPAIASIRGESNAANS